MAHKTLFTCDRCKAEQEGNAQMWQVQLRYISMDHRYHSQNFDPYSQHAEQDWCRKCMDAMHVLKPGNAEPPVKTPQPTMEDFVRQLVRQEIEGARAAE